MGDIYCRYEISNPTNVIRPNDIIKGIFYVRNEDKKPQTLKLVEIQLVESWEEYKENRKGNWDWVPRENILKKYPLSSGEIIDPGQEYDYPFEIKLSASWIPKTGKKFQNFRDWYIALQFCQKTGTFTTRGANKDEATCVLPVEDSNRPGSFSSDASSPQPSSQNEDPVQPAAKVSSQEVFTYDKGMLDNLKKLIAKGDDLIIEGNFMDSSIVIEQAKNLAEELGDTALITLLHNKLDDICTILMKGSTNQVKDPRWEKFVKILKLYSEVTLDKLTQLLGFNTNLELEDWLLKVPGNLPFKISGDTIKIDNAYLIPALVSLRLSPEKAGIEADSIAKVTLNLSPPPVEKDLDEQITYWIEAGKMLQSAGENNRALEAYYKAISLDFNNPDAWLNLGILLASLKRKKEALAAFWKVKNSAPSHWSWSFLVEHLIQQLDEDRNPSLG